ncbi:MAG: hypothetical protein KJ929_02690 [Euryarchaeota archaeon]|nr:hypothetical protein [Euryarchaeota archaeon]
MGAEIDEISKSINEHQTRKELIDPVLHKIGWIEKYIKEEVNSIKSDFNQKHFILFNVDSIEKGIDRFIDYVLLDEDFTYPLQKEWC